MTTVPLHPEPPAGELRPGEQVDPAPPPSVDSVVGHIAPPRDPLRTQIRRVVEARAGAAIFAERLQDARELFEAAHAELIALAANAKETVAAEEETLRRLAVQAFEATGSKQPAPGVTIRVMQKLDYSTDAAFSWAKGKDLALALDRKAFEQIALTTELPFVTKVALPTAALAKDLAVAAGDA